LQTIENSLSPEWDEAIVELSILCGGNLDEPILLTVYDHEKDGKHVSMGRLETTVNALVLAASSGSELELTNRGKEAGSVVILVAQVITSDAVSEPAANATMPVDVASSTTPATTRPSFFDYLSGGCKIKVVVAIDFTGSNGDPRKPGTLHFMDAHSKNDYEKAISSVLTILQMYDDERKFPVLGFGAKLDGVINHCFQVGPAEFSHGVRGVLDSYNKVFESGLTLSNPTVFTEVIKNAAGRAQRSLEESRKNGYLSYTILLIVTDGAVSDVNETADCLREVSSSPLSVVIVGVGNEAFSAMQFLDDLKGRHRDMVQFVEFNKHSYCSVALTSATLKEIPNQLVECFQGMGYPPMPAVTVKEDEITSVVEDDEPHNMIDLGLNFKEDEIVVVRGGIDNRYEF
jgi:Copine